MNPTVARNIAVLCWLIALISSVATGNYLGGILFFINLIIGLITIEMTEHPIRDFYHHRKSIQSRRLRYSLFRQKVKSEPVEFENEAKKVIK